MTSIKRKGFTLVELLIVIVVIGILSAMMMLSSTEAVSSAKANNVVSNLRNIKTAVLSWYADNLDKVVLENKSYNIKENASDATGSAFKTYVKAHATDFTKYLSNEGSVTLKTKEDNLSVGDYMLTNINESKRWVICYYVGTDASMRSKLAAKASSTGLFGLSAKDTDPKDK